MKTTQTIMVQIDPESQVMTFVSGFCRSTYDPKTREMNFVLSTPEGEKRGVLKLPDKMKTPARTCRRLQEGKTVFK